MADGLRRPIPERYVEYYLGNPASLSWLLLVNAVAFLVGVAFYVTADLPHGFAMVDVPTFVYPFYGDSPTALALATLSLVTLLPNLGDRVVDAPANRPLAYLHTLAFVWLVKYGVWTAVALNLHPELYVGFTPAALWEYWGIMLTHLGFLVEAVLLPYYGATTRGALAFALALLLVNDVVDYGFGYFPPLRYDPGLALTAATVALSFGAVALAAWIFDRHESPVAESA
jgi:uncharacterized membrane protein YpjA